MATMTTLVTFNYGLATKLKRNIHPRWNFFADLQCHTGEIDGNNVAERTMKSIIWISIDLVG